MAAANNNRIPNVVLEDVRLIFRNFSGKEGQFNAKGDRNFNVILPSMELAEEMERDGWNIKYLAPREEEDQPTPRIEVKVKYGKGRPPRVVMVTSRGRTNLGEDEIDILDWAVIKHVDLIIRPYSWDINGRQGVTAYLQSIFVTIEEDELELKYADLPDAGDSAQSAVGASFEDELQ